MTLLTFIAEPKGGVDPSSPLGIFIIVIGVVFTIGLPVLLITKGKKKDK